MNYFLHITSCYFYSENRIANFLVILMEYLSYTHNLNHSVVLKH